MTKKDHRIVVVTGGNGALGRSVVDIFLDAGDRVLVPWIVKAEAEAMGAIHTSWGIVSRAGVGVVGWDKGA